MNSALKFLAIIFGLLATPCLVEARDLKIPYASKSGEELMVVKTSGINTTDAMIYAVHMKYDAAIYCKNQGTTGLDLKNCVKDEMDMIPFFVYMANCGSGYFTTNFGRYRYGGKWHAEDANDMGVSYRFINSDSGEVLDGSGASGYDTISEAYKMLCPASITGDPHLISGE